MTGWRLGAAVAPTELSSVFSKLNTNNESCTTHFVQWAGVEAVLGDQTGVTAIRETLRGRRDAAYDMLVSMPGVRLSKPNATFYLFPDVTEAMAAKGIDSLPEFADRALKETGCRSARGCTSVGRSRARTASMCGSPIPACRSRTSARAWASSSSGSRPDMAVVVVTNRIPESGMAKLRAEHEVRAWEHEECISREEALRLVAGADAVLTLLTERVDGEFLDAAGPAAEGRRQRGGRLQQHRRRRVRGAGGHRDQHPACSPRRRRTRRSGSCSW
jgi:hypothetical protein